MVGLPTSMLFAGQTVPLQVAVDPLIFVVVAFGVFLIAAIVAPVVLLSVRETREPTADERDQLAGLAEAADYELGTVAVVETVGEHSVELSIRGPPGRRWLLVTDYVMEELEAKPRPPCWPPRPVARDCFIWSTARWRQQPSSPLQPACSVG